MKKKRIIGVVVLLIFLPAIVALVEAATFYLRNHHNGTIVSSGETREYVLYVPKDRDPARPAPLVISMHGAGGWGAVQMRTSGWNRLADEHGFLVVYPSGVAGGGPRVWEVNPGRGLMKDVRFISDLIDDLETRYDIDPSRIYANGLSNGGGMSWALSCTLSHRIAAVGLVGAARTLPWDWCTDRKPVPVITFHGTADSIVPYAGGTSWVFDKRWPNVEEWTANWARRNHCEPNPVESEFAENVTRLEYTDCSTGADALLYSIEGGGHTWPGGEPLPEWFLGPTNREIDATRLMWEFFEGHPLR